MVHFFARSLAIIVVLFLDLSSAFPVEHPENVDSLISNDSTKPGSDGTNHGENASVDNLRKALESTNVKTEGITNEELGAFVPMMKECLELWENPNVNLNNESSDPSSKGSEAPLASDFIATDNLAGICTYRRKGDRI